MAEGLFKLTLKSLHLTADSPAGKSDYYLVLSLGETKATIKTKGTDVEFKNEVHLLKSNGSESLQIRVSEKESSEKSAFANFPIAKLSASPNVVHHVKVNLALKNGANLEEKVVGTLNVDLKFSHNLKRALLDVQVVKAKLTRDTEAIGKMDPFAKIKLGEMEKRTSVKDNVGKEPIWNEQYTLPIVNPLDKLIITVLDEDVTTDDVVGSAEIDLNEKGLLTGNDWKDHTINILWEEKSAGEIFIRTRYTDMK